jgi:hypothetical protein
MKKLIILLICLFAAVAFADITETLTFGWQQETLDYVTHWELEMGISDTGPFMNIGSIPYDGTPQAEFQAPLETTVTGPGGTTQTRYFRMRTCGDVPQPDGTTQAECSTGYSNVISHDFWIPAGEFQVPVQFRIIAQ